MVEEWRLTYTTVLFLCLLFLPLSHTDVWTHALTFSLPSIATRLFSCWWSQAQRGCYISRWLSSAKASPTDTHASTGHTYSHPCTCRSPRMQDVCSQMSSLQKTCCFTYKHIHTLSFPPADTNIRQATKNWLPSHEIRLKEVYCHSLFKVNEVLISVRLCIHKPSVMNYTVVLWYIIKTLKGQTDFTHIHHCYGFFWDGPLHLVKSLFFREALSLFGGDDLTIVCLASYVFPLGKPQEQTGCLLSVRRYGKAEPHCVSLSGG